MSDPINPSEQTALNGYLNEPIKLRPHHGLCMAFFIGMGYSDEFTENMRSVIDMLNESCPDIILTEGSDVICSSCPKNIGNVCESRVKSDRYDRDALEICGLEFGKVLKWKTFSSLCREKIVSPRRLSFVCGDCEWYEHCGSCADR